MKRLTGLLILLLPILAGAEVVVPIESVENHVNIRMSPDSASEVVGRLNQGDYLPLVESTAEWHEVEIAGGATGFISADWTVVLDDPPTVVEEDEPRPNAEDVDNNAEDEVVADESESSAGDDAVDEVEDVEDAKTAVLEDLEGSLEENAVADENVAPPDAEEIAEQAAKVVTVEAETAPVEELDAGDARDVEAVVATPDDETSVPEVEASDSDIAEVQMASDESADELADKSADESVEALEEVTAAVDDIAPVVPEAGADASPAETDAVDEAYTAPTVTEAEAGSQRLSGLPGPQGPQGIPGPPGPTGASTIEGSVGFLTRFTAPTIGGTSQVFDDGNNIGIGTTEPKQRLEVNGNIQIHERNSSVAGLMITQSDGETGYIMHNRASTLTIGAGSVDRITVDRDGNVGFGVSRPSNPIEMASGAHVTAGGVWTNSSSREKKENIALLSLDDALATLTELEPVRFNYKSDQVESYVGFIAEDVPELVATSDRDGLSSMDIVAVLTRVVQEQQKKIEALEARLDQR